MAVSKTSFFFSKLVTEHADRNSAEAESVPGADTTLRVLRTPAPRAALDLLSHATSTHAPLPMASLSIPTLGMSPIGNGDSCVHATLLLSDRNIITNSLMLWLTCRRREKGTYIPHLLCSKQAPLGLDPVPVISFHTPFCWTWDLQYNHAVLQRHY